jgi:hypothetical protein
MTYRERAAILPSRRLMPEGWATTRMTTIKLGHLPHGAWGRAMIDWKKIRHSVETAALLSGMAAGYLAPALIYSATDRTLQLSPCSCEEAIASDDEDHEGTDCDHLKPFSVRDVQGATDD